MPFDRKGWEKALAKVLALPETYKIVRYSASDDEPRTMQMGLTLEEAQAHCKRADTRGDGWFDGYVSEDL